MVFTLIAARNDLTQLLESLTSTERYSSKLTTTGASTVSQDESHWDTKSERRLWKEVTAFCNKLLA